MLKEDVGSLNKILNSFVDGREVSPCPKPCLETKVIKVERFKLNHALII